MSEQLHRQETQLSPQETLQAGAEFLQHFGVEVNPLENPEQFTEALAQLDPRYQGGRNLVRFELEADQTEWPEDTKQVIMGAAESMRMLETETPLVGDYDVVIALGGARQSNLDRTRYAVESTKDGKASFKHLVVAGSSRELNEAEQQNTANYAPGATTEFDLVAGAAKTVAQENPGVITSQFFVEDKKAGTPAVIEAVLKNLKDNGVLKANSKIAAVTTQIYQASTQLDLERVAHQFGITEAFTAGNPSDPKVIEARKPATYLSEVLRTLRAAVNGAKDEQAFKVLYDANRAEQIKVANERNANNSDVLLDENGVDQWGFTLEDHEAGRYRSGGLVYNGWNDPGMYDE